MDKVCLQDVLGEGDFAPRGLVSKRGNTGISAVCLIRAQAVPIPSDSAGDGASLFSPRRQNSPTQSWPHNHNPGFLTIPRTTPVAACGKTRRSTLRWRNERKLPGNIPARSGAQHPGNITEHLGIPVSPSATTAARPRGWAAAERCNLVYASATSPIAVLHPSVFQSKEHQCHGT